MTRWTPRTFNKLALLGTTFFAAPGIAHASEGKGLTLAFGPSIEGLSDPELAFVDAGSDGKLGTADDDTVVTSLSTPSAVGLRAGIGYDFGDIRVEVNASYSRHKAKSLKIKSFNGIAVTNLSAGDVQDFADFAFDDADVDPASLTISGNAISSTSGSIAKVRNVAATANVYYDIPTGGKVTPYVGAGVGIGGQHIKSFDSDEGFTKLTWKLSAGASYAISEKVSIVADYSYRQTGKGKLIGSDNTFETRVGKTKTHSLGVSLRVTF
jgi:opacity protein-like surface antigen